MKIIGNYIGGNITSNSKKLLNIEDPSKGEIISQVVLSNKTDFDEAVKSSQNSFLNWSEVTPLKRSRILSKYKLNMEKL